MIPPKWLVDGSSSGGGGSGDFSGGGAGGSEGRRRGGGCLLPRIELTASSPTAGHVPPLSPVKNLGVPSLVLHTADSLDNVGPPIPR